MSKKTDRAAAKLAAATATPATDLPVETTETSTTTVETTEEVPPVEVTEDLPVEVATPAPSKQDLLNAKRKAARDAKAAEKAVKKAETAAKRADGIIGTLYTALCQPNGTTKKEVLDQLTAKFPDRDRDGMAVTVGIQLSRLAKQASPKHPEEFENGRPVTSTKAFGEARGRVYGFSDTIELPVIVAEGTPAATEENVEA